MLADGPSIRAVHRRHRSRVRRRREDPLRPEGRRRGLVQRRRAAGRSTTLHEATGETRTYTLRLPHQLHRLLQLRRRLPADLPRRGAVHRVACVHPQHWPEDLDYTGKKVVVIGSGATAVTLVPAMAGDAEHVTMLQRSPSYVVLAAGGRQDLRSAGPVPVRTSGCTQFGRKRNIAIQRRVLPGVPTLARIDAPASCSGRCDDASARAST